MEMFEGYVGIQIGEEQWIDDITLSLLLLLFVSFAFIFHRYAHLFVRMLKDVVFVKKRASLFEEAKGDDTVFYRFMIFQTLFLTSLTALLLGYRAKLLPVQNAWNVPILLLLILIVITFYYQFKRFLNYIIALVFVEKEKYELWHTGYRAIVSSWGVLLYIPAGWMILWKGPFLYPFLFFAVLYILSRLAIIYKLIRIFSMRKSDYFYLLLYLCAQEIMPLFLLIVGTYYSLYNFIEMTTLWR